MNIIIKKLLFLFFLTAFSILLFLPARGSSEEFNAQTKTLQFLSDVVMLDLSRYEIKLKYDEVEVDSGLGGALRERVVYTLFSNDSYCVVTCVYTNKVYDYSLIGWNKGSPVYTEPQPTNPVEFAKKVLERFQAFIGSTRYQQLIDMLDVIGKTGQTTIVSNNFKLTETVNSGRVNFRWVYTINDFEASAFGIVILNGALYGINDATDIFTVSDTPVVISEQQAVEIALEKAAEFSWRASDGKEYTVTDPIPSNSVKTQQILNIRSSGDPFTLYPLWKITLWLGKTYPGGVNHIVVGVWADTGEVSYIQALSSGGSSHGGDQNAESPSTASPPQPSTPTPNYSQPSDSPSSNDQTSPPESHTQQPDDVPGTPELPVEPTPEPSEPTETPAFPSNATQILVVTAAGVTVITMAGASLYVKKKRR